MGWPTRVTRLAFGVSTYLDKIPVRDPVRQIAAKFYNLAFWQTAGLNVCSPIAFAELVIDGAGAVTLGASGEAWDPDGGVVPTVTKEAGNGHYRITYAATAPDETGASITIDLKGATPNVQSQVLYHAQGERSAANVIDVWIWNAAGSLADPVSSKILVPIW
jgi:hypothetical protein